MIDKTTEKPIDVLTVELHPNNLPREGGHPIGKDLTWQPAICAMDHSSCRLAYWRSGGDKWIPTNVVVDAAAQLC
jgi:hypothetical protein